MQYKVDPTCQTRENGHKPDHSKQPTHRTKNFLKNQPDVSRTSGFRGEFTERPNFQIQQSNITNPALDFRQNRLKVKKTQKRPFLSTFS